VSVATVVKVGGGLLEQAGRLEEVLAEIASVSACLPMLLVPGGGPFADTVRQVDARVGLSDEAAHWMAVLGMDQYAHLIAARLEHGALVHDRAHAARAWDEGRLPVLAPYRWLREADPLPHTWDVTSDSIAAWVAGQVGARRLVLVKPARATGDRLVDDYFAKALPDGVELEMVPADRTSQLRASLLRVAAPSSR
jgi:aspartokinase-like uncharacterized kinase